ncbi:hypothetical protein T4B_10920 [Trichinella pseudospiralis]|uniref:Uncharacterized protein n=1 Tax=Trichinella pseudospiralis TaxID=6337 RepID=A0A0V1JQT7_TRIPS|nr:hypothetical protein T4B_10920 [Trichinella pseudospiralis]KRZ37336.1 hypothetical protein T4C_9225 [Trichinella pseudospiralis]
MPLGKIRRNSNRDASVKQKCRPDTVFSSIFFASRSVVEQQQQQQHCFAYQYENKEMQIHKSPPFRIDSRLMSASRLVASYELNYNGVAAIVALNTHSRQASDDNAYYL